VAEYEKNRAEAIERKANKEDMPRSNRAQRVSMVRAARNRACATARWSEISASACNEPAPVTDDPNDQVQVDYHAQALTVEQQRQKNIDAATKTLPVTADRPLPDKNGAIVTPTQRCTSATRTGAHCKARTTIGQYCWIHLQQHESLRVKASSIPGIGRGLFATKFIKSGDKIAQYSGDLVPITDEYDETKGSMYVLEINSELLVCAARTNAGVGRWANDARNSRNSDNAYFCCDQRSKTACIKATRDIEKDEEIFVPYSDEFWIPRPESRIQRRLRIRAARHMRAGPARGGAIKSKRARKTGVRVDDQEEVNLVFQDVIQLITKIGAWARA
jgi:uncharacterized protein